MSDYNILHCLKLEEVTDEETLRIVYGDRLPVDPAIKLRKWLSLLPNTITKHVDAALRQERPFLPPDVTPEMVAVKNSKLPAMSQMEILYRCVHFAFQAKQFNMAACLAYVVDRATYWSGLRASKALLHVVDLIKKADPTVAIAPQVQVRKARVSKDEGDLHGAMKILDDILRRRQNVDGEWFYKDDDQYITTQAEIIKIKGHILYNMGLLKEAVEPVLESIRLFASLQNKDDKGIASCLGLLTKCLGKLSLEEFEEVRQKFPDNFKNDHPCYESYEQGIQAIQHIESLQESLYSSRHLLDADTSLLKFAILSQSISEEYNWLKKIMDEMKKSLGSHRTVEALSSSEQFFEFVRALFMISLVLGFSPLQQDRSVSEYLQQVSMELYLNLCNHNESQPESRLSHTARSLKLVNLTLTVLGLPVLLFKEEIATSKEEYQNKMDNSRSAFVEEVSLSKQSAGGDENLNVGGNRESEATTFPQSAIKMGGNARSNTHPVPFESTSVTEPFTAKLTLSAELKQGRGKLHQTAPNSSMGKPVTTNKNTSRGWTYNFGHKTRTVGNITQSKQAYHTFPMVNHGRPLDPKKQWQTYKHKCVGLPVDPAFFALPVALYENVEKDEKKNVSPPLVNLSVTYINKSVEHRTKASEMDNSLKYSGLVDRLATTVQRPANAVRGASDEQYPLHPHDLPNQPMKRCEKDQLVEDTDASTFSPLVDLKVTAIGKFLELDFGESICVDDAVEYIFNWQPPKEFSVENKSHRAFLLNYNPTTSVWTCQSTLAVLGNALKLSEDNQGNCRDAFHVQFLHQDEPRGKYVGKRYRDIRNHNPKRYMQDVVCQMMAGYYVTRFNEALIQNYKRDIEVRFLPAAHLQLLSSEGQLEDCINVEPYFQGEFAKLTNNLTWATTDGQGKELATALSHFSYCESKGALMIVDIQGWLPKENSGVIYLTDPQFHTYGLTKFSPYDFSEKGMEEFWKSVHPSCNDMCRALGLERS